MTPIPLFTIGDIPKQVTAEPPHPKKGQACATACAEREMKIGRRMESCSQAIGRITMGKTIHYATSGDWSMHDLLFHLLEQTGPAHVHTATWSITEDPIRAILGRMSDGRILSFHPVMDWRVKVRTPAVLALAKANLSDVKLANCHAKATVVINNQWGIAVVGSANYTNNPRIEAGVIDCSMEAAEFHRQWISDQMRGADPFEVNGADGR